MKRVLLDESVPRALGFELAGHFVRTVQAAGFSGYANGALLAAMQEAKFDVLITFDQSLPYQQSADLPVSVLILVANDNRLPTAKAFVPQLLEALKHSPMPKIQRFVMTTE